MKKFALAAMVCLALGGALPAAAREEGPPIEPVVLTRACIDSAAACTMVPLPVVSVGDRKALQADEKACKASAAREACLRVGYAYETGSVFKADAKKAGEYLGKAANLAAAAELSGRRQLLNAGDSNRLLKARTSYYNACKIQEPSACRAAFDLQLMDPAGPRERDLSDVADRGCRGGDALLCQRILDLNAPGGLSFWPSHSPDGIEVALRTVCAASPASPQCGAVAMIDDLKALTEERNAAMSDCMETEAKASCRRALELSWTNPVGGEKSPRRAFSSWERLCWNGEPSACGDMVRALDADPASLKEHSGAYIRMGRLGCDLGDATSCAAYIRLLKKEASEVRAYQYASAACAKGITPACTEASAFSASVRNSAGAPVIDPSLSGGQRYMLAARHLNEGDIDEGIWMLTQLAREENRDAQTLLGSLYLTGVEGHLAKDEATGLAMLREAQKELNPRAIYHLVSWETRGRRATNDEFALMRIAVQHGVPGAKEWDEAQRQAIAANNDAIRAANAALMAERAQSLAAINRMNREAAGQMDRQTVARAWEQYFDRQQDADGERVCTLVKQGQRTYQDCMSKDTFDRYYTPWGGK